MPKHTIVTMPGDGIGNQVLPEAIRVLDAVGFEAEYVHADIGWECWIKEGNALPERTIDLLRKHKVGLFGAITSKPKKEAEAELSPALKGKGLSVLQPHRVDAADLQSRYLHAALPVVPRQSAELHSQEARRRIRRAEGRRRGLPPEHRRPVRRGRMDESAAAGARRAAHSSEVQAVRQRAGRGPGDFGAHHHAAGSPAHLRSGFPARAQVRLQIRDHLREAERAARDLGHDGRGRQGSAEAVSATSRCGPPTSTRRPCGSPRIPRTMA